MIEEKLQLLRLGNALAKKIKIDYVFLPHAAAVWQTRYITADDDIVVFFTATRGSIVCALLYVLEDHQQSFLPISVSWVPIVYDEMIMQFLLSLKGFLPPQK